MSTDLSEMMKPCEYCGPGIHTGLPSNACENCMNTGFKHPHCAELVLAAVELTKIPGDVYWLFRKGKTKPDEPWWGIQLRSLGDKILAEGEADHPVDAIRMAMSHLGGTP